MQFTYIFQAETQHIKTSRIQKKHSKKPQQKVIAMQGYMYLLTFSPLHIKFFLALSKLSPIFLKSITFFMYQKHKTAGNDSPKDAEKDFWDTPIKKVICVFVCDTYFPRTFSLIFIYLPQVCYLPTHLGFFYNAATDTQEPIKGVMAKRQKQKFFGFIIRGTACHVLYTVVIIFIYIPPLFFFIIFFFDSLVLKKKSLSVFFTRCGVVRIRNIIASTAILSKVCADAEEEGEGKLYKKNGIYSRNIPYTHRLYSYASSSLRLPHPRIEASYGFGEVFPKYIVTSYHLDNPDTQHYVNYTQYENPPCARDDFAGIFIGRRRW